jgi:hypothetical protein
MKNSIQPLFDNDGVLRFKSNAIVEYLLDHGGIDLNDLAEIEFSNDDRQHFAQLIGYSLSGFGELSYVSDIDYITAELKHFAGQSDVDTRIEVLLDTINELKRGLREPIARLYDIHPDDLGD